MTLGNDWNCQKVVYVITDTADIYCFCKHWYETAQENMLFKLPPVSLNQIEKSLAAYFFQNCEKFIRFKILTPRAKKKLGENPTTGAVRMGKSLGVTWRKDGQAWNWLIHYVIDPILVIHYCCSCFNISMKTVKFASLNLLYFSNYPVPSKRFEKISKKLLSWSTKMEGAIFRFVGVTPAHPH